MTNPIAAEQLTENTYVVVDGYIDYSHVTSLIEGEALAKRNETRRFPIQDPHTSISLRDARIRPASGDPSRLSLEEQFVQNSFYDSKVDPTKTNMYSIDNKTQQLPAIYEPKDPNDLTQGYEQVIEPAGELDRDLSATLVLQVYKPQKYEKRGIGLRLINVNEPIRYFSGGGMDLNFLQQMGIVLSSAPVPTVASTPENATNAGANNYTDYSSGHGLPTPGIGGGGQSGAPAQGQPTQQNQPQQGYQAPTPQPQAQSQQVQQQGYAPQNQYAQPQAPAQQQQAQQPQQGYQPPAPQAQQSYQAPAQNQQQVPSPAQPGQSAFDAGAAPMNQQAGQYAQPQNGQNPENQSPWPQNQPGMHYQA